MVKRSNGKQPSAKTTQPDAAGISRHEIREDLRIRRTKRLLQEALFDLILEKGYHAISIDDIVTRAMVGKSTLYAHFRGKEDLLRNGLMARMHSFIKLPATTSNQEPSDREENSILSFFGRVASDRKLAKALLCGPRNPIAEDFLLEEFQNQLKKLWSTTAMDQDLYLIDGAAIFASNALLSLFLWWLKLDPPPPPPIMDGLCNRLIQKGLESAGPGFILPL